MSDSVFLTDGNGIITELVNPSYSGALEIPEYVGNERIVGIGYGAFQRCSSLTSVTIPNSVTTIGDEAFLMCYALTSIEIPDSVTSIGDRAFATCESLTSVTIPNSVTSIGDEAFRSCENLTTVYAHNPNNLSEAISSYDWSNTGSVVTFIDSRPACYIDYLIKGGILMGIADKIRVLSSTTAEMSPVEIQNELDNLNTELGIVIDEQIDLIAQIMNALDGKVIPPFNYKAIYFSIGTTYYAAEEDMTWGEWVESNYNDGTVSLEGTEVFRLPNAVRDDYVSNGGKNVHSYEKILPNHAYTN